MQRAGRAAVLAGCSLLARGLFACSAANVAGDLLADVRDLQARTVPPGAKLVAESPITRDTWSAEATWDVEASTSWDEYVEQVREHLLGFTPARGDSHSALFTRTLQDDSHTVRVGLLSAGPPLRVRVTFDALAN